MKLYNPPLNAQFLRDVSLTVHASEVHGIIGTAGRSLRIFTITLA